MFALAVVAPAALPAAPLAHPSFPTTDGIVWALAVSGNTLYVGGGFTHVGGLPRNRIAAIDLTTEQVTAWNPNANSEVKAIQPRDGIVYISGYFRQLGGQANYGVAAVDSSTGAMLPWKIPYPDVGENFSLAVTSDAVFVGSGIFGTQLKAYSRTNGDSILWSKYLGTSGKVEAMALVGGHLFVAGRLDSIDKTGFHGGLVMLDPKTGALQQSYSDYVYTHVGHSHCLAVGNGRLFIGGYVGVTAIDTMTDDVIPWYADVPADGVFAMATAPSRVYLGGAFATVNGSTRHNLAAIGSYDAWVKDWAPSADGIVLALVTAHGTIYAGGAFTSVDGQPHANPAAIDDPPYRVDAPVEGSAAANLILRAPVPNPFRSSSEIRLDLPREGTISLDLVDLAGRSVRRVLPNQSMPAGRHELTLTRYGLAAGLYWLRLSFEGRSMAQRVVLLP